MSWRMHILTPLWKLTAVIVQYQPWKIHKQMSKAIFQQNSLQRQVVGLARFDMQAILCQSLVFVINFPKVTCCWDGYSTIKMKAFWNQRTVTCMKKNCIIKLLYSLYYILYMVSIIQFILVTSGNKMQIMNAFEYCKLTQHKKHRVFICGRCWKMHRREHVRMLLLNLLLPCAGCQQI